MMQWAEVGLALLKLRRLLPTIFRINARITIILTAFMLFSWGNSVFALICLSLMLISIFFFAPFFVLIETGFMVWFWLSMLGILGESGVAQILFVPLFATVCIFVLLRIYSVGAAIQRTYARPCCPTRSSHVELFLVFFGLHWDWWAFDHMDEEFMKRPWYKRLWRPLGLHDQRQKVLSRGDPTESEASARKTSSVSSILVGKEVFKNRAYGEGTWLRLGRGFMAIIILCGLIYFMAIMVYIKPLEETNVPSMQVQELIDDPIKDLDADDMWLGYPKWGAVIGLPKSFSSDVPDHEFVSVKLIMQSESTGAEEAPMNEWICKGTPLLNVEEIQSSSSRRNRLAFFSYNCTPEQPGVYDSTLISQIVVTVNFSNSGTYSMPSEPSVSFDHQHPLYFWPIATKNVVEALKFTRSHPLIPGMHNIGILRTRFMRRYTNSNMATFGFGDKSRLYMGFDTEILGTDPSASPGTSIPDQTTTLRVFVAQETRYDEVFGENRVNTVISGLAAVGGLATFLNSCFFILFGGNLLLVLLGVKPLGIFGALHLFSGDRLRQEHNKIFPLINTEGGQPGDPDSGVVSFLRDNLLDLGPVAPTKRATTAQKDDTAESGLESSTSLVGRADVLQNREDDFMLEQFPPPRPAGSNPHV